MRYSSRLLFLCVLIVAARRHLFCRSAAAAPSESPPLCISRPRHLAMDVVSLSPSSGGRCLSCIHTFCRRICRKCLQHTEPDTSTSGQLWWSLGWNLSSIVLSSAGSVRTCKEGHEHGHPAQDVGPGEAPVSKALPQEVDRHSGINGHSQQHKESWGGGGDRRGAGSVQRSTD